MDDNGRPLPRSALLQTESRRSAHPQEVGGSGAGHQTREVAPDNDADAGEAASTESRRSARSQEVGGSGSLAPEAEMDIDDSDATRVHAGEFQTASGPTSCGRPERVAHCFHKAQIAGVKCEVCNIQACAQCWLVSGIFIRSGRFFKKIRTCSTCAGIRAYDVAHAEALKEIEDTVKDKMDRNEVLDSEFKTLCIELLQIFVDSGTQGSLDLARDRKEIFERILKVWTEGSRRDDPPINPWNLEVMNVVPPELVLAIAKLYQQKTTAPFDEKVLKKTLIPANETRLRIVFMTFELSDNHPLVLLLHSFFMEMCKRPDVEILLIDTTPVEQGRLGRRAPARDPVGQCSRLITELGSRYVDCTRLRNQNAAAKPAIVKMIKDFNTAIIVCLGYFQSGSDLQRDIITEKPAPLIVQFLSHMGTTGSDAVDLIVVDPIAFPEEMARHISEKALYLLGSFFPGRGVRDWHPNFLSPEGAEAVRRVRQGEGLPPDDVLIGFFSDFDRMDPKWFASCCRVLKGIDNSKAVTISRGTSADERLRERANRHGCHGRFLFLAFVDCDKQRLWSLMAALDFFYDPWSYNAHTMFVEILWSPCIVLSLAGRTLASRVGVSLLNAHGVKECIHESEASMEAHAIRLGNSTEERQKLRKLFWTLRYTSPVFGDGFALNFTAGLRVAWKERVLMKASADLQSVRVSPRDIQWLRQHESLMQYAKVIIPKTDDLETVVVSLESLGLFCPSQEDGQSSNNAMSSKDALVIFKCLQDLGFSNLRYDSSDKSHIMLNCMFRFSNAKIRINAVPNLEWDKDGAVHDAYFLLKCSASFGSCFCVSALPFDEKFSPADVVQLTVGGNCYSILTTLQNDDDVPLEEVYRELAVRFAKWPESDTAVDELVEVLYQVLKLCQACHEKGFALKAARRKLMLCKMEDGYGRTAISRLRFRGESFALFVSFGVGEEQQEQQEPAVPVKKSLSIVVKEHEPVKETFEESRKTRGTAGRVNKRVRSSAGQKINVSHTQAAPTLRVIRAWQIEEYIKKTGAGSVMRVDHGECIPAFVSEDLQYLARPFLDILQPRGMESVEGLPSELSVPRAEPSGHQSLLLLLRGLTEVRDSISVKSVLQNKLFKKLSKPEPHFADLCFNNVPDWTMLPYISFWRRTLTILPKVLHFYVEGGPYDCGGGKIIDLKPVWLVFNTEKFESKVVIAVPGKLGDIVAVYLCPIYDLHGPWFDFVDGRWVISIKPTNLMYGFNGRACELFNIRIACENRNVGPFLNSSKDAQGTNKTAAKGDKNKNASLRNGSIGHKRRSNILSNIMEKLQNCEQYYPHGWNHCKAVTPQQLYAKPWLATIGFKLTCNLNAYAELLHPYDWYRRQSDFEKSFMAHGKISKPVALKSTVTASKRAKVGMDVF